jgi:hypothetical protein
MIWSRLICGISAPFDLPALLALLPRGSPLSSPDEMQVAFHPTRTRVWSRHRVDVGNVCREAPGDNRKVYGFGLLDWRDG